MKAVLLDMDGLMFDTEKLLQRFWVQAAHELGFPMKPETVLSIRSLCRKFAEPYLKREVCEDFDYTAVRARRIELMNAYIKENGIEKKKGLDNLLDRMRASNIKVAVCTATDYARTKMYLTMTGVLDKLNTLICGNYFPFGKPAPDIYMYACKQLGFEPGECVALEDSPNGIISAAMAGLNVIMVPDLTQPTAELMPFITAVCADLDEVGDRLLEAGSRKQEARGQFAWQTRL